MRKTLGMLILFGLLATPGLAMDDAVVKGNTALALDLYGALKQKPGNLFFCPYSISTALAMTYAGARTQTEKEMAAVLHLPGQPAAHAGFRAWQKQVDAAQGKGVALHVANALWAQQGHPFLKPYLAVVKKYYRSEVRHVDFITSTEAARREINAWVSTKTAHTIEDLLPVGILDRLTRLVLVNAIYFKGRWAGQFSKDATHMAPFHPSPGATVTVPMMYQKASFGYREDKLLQILELPYAGQRCSMVVLLPSKTSGLSGLEKELTSANLARWLSGLKPREVAVWLPRFKLSAEFSLRDTLAGLGMSTAFDPAKADFSGMDGTRELSISAVIHKAFVEVNEEGTEAAAATAVVMMKLSAPTRPIEFRADRPFLFLIRDQATGSILFLGRVVNPR